jgi:hypothetical protein
VVIHAGEPEVLEGGLAQILKNALLRCLRRKNAGPHVVKERLELRPGHHSRDWGFLDCQSSRALTWPAVLRDGFICL